MGLRASGRLPLLALFANLQGQAGGLSDDPMGSVEARIAANYARITGRIEQACRRAGRPTGDVRLVAVTKSAEIGWIEALLALGVRDLGESRPQQLCERVPLIDKPVAWHRSEEHTSELQSHVNLVCRLLLAKKKTPSTEGSTTLKMLAVTSEPTMKRQA